MFLIGCISITFFSRPNLAFPLTKYFNQLLIPNMNIVVLPLKAEKEL